MEKSELVAVMSVVEDLNDRLGFFAEYDAAIAGLSVYPYCGEVAVSLDLTTLWDTENDPREYADGGVESLERTPDVETYIRGQLRKMGELLIKVADSAEEDYALKPRQRDA